MKLSRKIVLRTRFEDYKKGKRYLLHEATYADFLSPHWYSRAVPEDINPEKNDTTWNILPAQKDYKIMTFYMRLGGNRAVLKLPSGSFRIEQMRAALCKRNPFGTVIVEKGPFLIKGRVSYNPDIFNERMPRHQDLAIPEIEKQTIADIVAGLHLKNESESEIIHRIKLFFAGNFSYSLDLEGKGEYETPLHNFLLNTQQGHCEFFATATALILRQAGIPARYSTGYLAHEFSPLNKMVTVREKDAHAWVKMYVNGRWQNLDTTPPSFVMVDNRQSGTSQVRDLISFLWFKLLQLRYETGTKLMEKYGLWLIIPLGGFLFYRFRTSKRIKRVRARSRKKEQKNEKGKQSKFYLIEKALLQKGFTRDSSETYAAWFKRIEKSLAKLLDYEKLMDLLRLHNKIRFSRHAVSDKESSDMDIKVEGLLKTLVKKKVGYGKL
ncbi:MAG: transglutaminase domain-containing protein [Desulfobacteraceae bacterium]|nr:transglutaminase domain-containing protein [Desulfobacteraceae bacterium]